MKLVGRPVDTMLCGVSDGMDMTMSYCVVMIPSPKHWHARIDCLIDRICAVFVTIVVSIACYVRSNDCIWTERLSSGWDFVYVCAVVGE